MVNDDMTNLDMLTTDYEDYARKMQTWPAAVLWTVPAGASQAINWFSDDYFLLVDASTNATAASTVILPKVDEAEGEVYTIFLLALSGTYYVTVTDSGDDIDFTDDVLGQESGAAGESVAYYSDGEHWYRASHLCTGLLTHDFG